MIHQIIDVFSAGNWNSFFKEKIVDAYIVVLVNLGDGMIENRAQSKVDLESVSVLGVEIKQKIVDFAVLVAGIDLFIVDCRSVYCVYCTFSLVTS